MDADEKLLALKTAYADIILNISKEAATRVMTSERRTAHFQHEMKMAKEESLRMLMRMKHIMDSKMSEGEAASLNQQKKIVELEAQLQEAEDIVRDLRGELAQVQAELESVKSGNLQCQNEMPLDKMEYSYQSIGLIPPLLQNRCNVASGANISYLDQRQECHKCYNKLECTCSVYVQNRDLPSIILRGKDSSLYKNGRTQRIHACERNVLDREVKNQKEDKDMSEAPVSCTKTANEIGKNLLANVKVGGSQSSICKRKRATRHRKPVRALNSNLSMAQVPVSIKEGGCLVENPTFETQTLSSDHDVPYPVVTEASETENLVEILDPGKVGDSNVKFVPFEDKTGFVEDWCLPEHGKSDVDKDDVRFQSVEDPSDLNEMLPSQSVRERVIKYTFQRKRKRPAQAGPEAKNSIKTETNVSDKQDCNKKSEQSESSSVRESSRECRRMAQVARQLLSLSEKKWWD